MDLAETANSLPISWQKIAIAAAVAAVVYKNMPTNPPPTPPPSPLPYDDPSLSEWVRVHTP